MVRSQPRRTSTGHTRCGRRLWTRAGAPLPAVSGPTQTAARCIQIGVVNKYSYPPLGSAKVKRRWKGDKRHRDNAGLQKSGGRKTQPLPYDLRRSWDYIYFSLLYATFCQNSNSTPRPPKLNASSCNYDGRKGSKIAIGISTHIPIKLLHTP